MIEKTRNGWEVTCDSCPDFMEFERPEFTFSSMIDSIKERGWRIEKLDSEWIHTCAGCVIEEKSK